MSVELSQDDRGKTVVSRNKRLGVVADVQSGTAYVDPDFDNVPEGLQEQLDWRPDGDCTLAESEIADIHNDQVLLEDAVWPR